MPGIFLSYRRDDTEAWAGRLYEALQERLPSVVIFRDIDNIPPGVKFADYIRAGVVNSDVLVALIGPNWGSAPGAGGTRRIDDESDFVRLEIETAIHRRIPIVPVLVGGAAMPLASSLPASIRDLAEWQNHELASRMWKESCDRLADAIRPLVLKGRTPRRLWPLALTGALAAGALVGVVLFIWPALDAPKAVSPSPQSEPVSEALSAAASRPALPIPPSPTSLFSKLQLAGRWALEKDKGVAEFDVNQTPAVLSIKAPGDSPKPITLDLTQPKSVRVDVPSDRDRSIWADVQFSRREGGFSWTANVFERSGSADSKVAEADGTVSEDLRLWTGRMTAGNTSSLTASTKIVVLGAKLSADDKVLDVTINAGGKVETGTFRKQ